MEGYEKNNLRDDLKNYDPESFSKPSVTVDIAVCSFFEDQLKVLLINRKFPPFRDSWAIPGGFLDLEKNENLEKTANRVLLKETNIEKIYLEQLKTYGEPDRDPRMRVITIAYFALIAYEDIKNQNIIAFDDAKDVQWFDLKKLPDNLAFDHKKILNELLERLVGKISYTPIAFNLVSKEFTWGDLQKVYEVILSKKLITPNFRRKIKDLYKIDKLKGKRILNEPGRPPVYLKFNGIKKVY